jgi:RNA polymerase sigma factor (TIGR02999 family)
MPDLATLLPCRRPELVVCPLGDRGPYVVKDPRGGAYYHLGEEEHFLLTQFDGRRDAEAIRAAFAERFGQPLRIGRRTLAAGGAGGYTPAERTPSLSRVPPMSEVTRILSAVERGEPQAAQLLPLVYEALRKLAAQKLVQEAPGQTLQATALVHEAYLRLVGTEQARHWNSRGHFFAAAAEAMRRILVERARARGSFKRGGGRARLDLEDLAVASPERPEDLLALDEALTRLAAVEPQAAELVHLRYFAGQTMSAAAELLGLSLRSTHRLWAYAKAWLLAELERE